MVLSPSARYLAVPGVASERLLEHLGRRLALAHAAQQHGVAAQVVYGSSTTAHGHTTEGGGGGILASSVPDLFSAVMVVSDGGGYPGGRGRSRAP